MMTQNMNVVLLHLFELGTPPLLNCAFQDLPNLVSTICLAGGSAKHCFSFFPFWSPHSSAALAAALENVRTEANEDERVSPERYPFPTPQTSHSLAWQ